MLLIIAVIVIIFALSMAMVSGDSDKQSEDFFEKHFEEYKQIIKYMDE